MLDLLPFGAVPRRDAAARVAAQQALDLVGLPRDRQLRSASDLSLAEQKRVDIARAIASHPRLLLLDEPTAGLAEAEMDALAEVLREVHRAGAVTIVVIAHHMGFIRTLAERAVVLDFGRVVATGTPAEVLSQPDVISVFVGGADA